MVRRAILTFLCSAFWRHRAGFTDSSPVLKLQWEIYFSEMGTILNQDRTIDTRRAMPNRDVAALLLDHTHCRAICDEIGDRLRDVLKRETSQLPLRLRALIDKLAQLEIDNDPVQLQDVPSIAPSIDETSFLRGRESRFLIKQSADPALPATIAD
jgi:hypothetical protein